VIIIAENVQEGFHYAQCLCFKYQYLLQELSELIHSLFSALFGFAILPDDEKRIVRVIGDIAKILIAEYQGAISSFFHHQTALSLSFR